MTREYFKWLLEQAIKHEEKVIGMTTVLLALLTAGATLLGHRAHTEEVIHQTLATDQWGFYQAKHIRAHMYGIEAEKALVSNQKELAVRYFKIAVYEQCGEPAEEGCMSKTPFKDSPLLQQFANAQSTAVPNADGPRLPGRGVADATARAVRVKGAETSRDAAHKDGALDISNKANSEIHQVDLFKERALHYDWAEILLECSIMMCGIALLVGTETTAKFALKITAFGVVIASAGIVVAVRGWLLH